MFTHDRRFMAEDRMAVLDAPAHEAETAVAPSDNGHLVRIEQPTKPDADGNFYLRDKQGNKYQTPLRLNLGNNGWDIPGFIGVDRKDGKEAYPLDYPDNSVDEIRASHIIEHFGHTGAQLALNDWYRALKPGGKLRVATVDLEKVCKQVIDKEPVPWLSYIYGGQTDENDKHGTGFTRDIMKAILRNVGFIGMKDWQSEINDCANLPISLNIEAVKPPKIDFKARKFIQAMMTAPRLNFTANRYCSLQAFVPLGIEEKVAEGVYYHQNMERLLQGAMEEGFKYGIVVDYDTIFTREMVERLIVLMETTPEADAIAPMQVRRDGNEMLLNMTGVETIDDLDPELMPAKAAHFGLTIIRLDALRGMPHPWFQSTPAPDGTWGDHRVDADMYFWYRFADHGKRLFVAPHLAIGHCQLMITWPNFDLSVRHQYMADWRKTGLPPDTVRV